MHLKFTLTLAPLLKKYPLLGLIFIHNFRKKTLIRSSKIVQALGPSTSGPTERGHSFYVHSEGGFRPQRRPPTCPRTHSLQEAGWGLEPRTCGPVHCHFGQPSYGKGKLPSHLAPTSYVP